MHTSHARRGDRSPRRHRRGPSAAAGRAVTVGHRPSGPSPPAAASQPLAAPCSANTQPFHAPSGQLSGLSAGADRKRAAEHRLDDLRRSGDAGGAGGHVCERIAGRAMGVRDIRVRTRHLGKGPCAREGPLRTAASGAKDSAPWRTITLPTCSRLSLECEEAPFTATVKQPAQQEHQRQTGRQDSTGEHAPLLRDCLAAAPAMPPRCASAQLSAESRSSSAGTIAGSRGARGALMRVVYARGPFLPYHTHP